MPRIELTTVVQADRATVFDACRDVGLHTASMGTSAERAIAGVTTGRLTAGDVVTWRARHFGLPWRMTVRITDYVIEFTAPDGTARRSGGRPHPAAVPATTHRTPQRLPCLITGGARPLRP